MKALRATLTILLLLALLLLAPPPTRGQSAPSAGNSTHNDTHPPAPRPPSPKPPADRQDNLAGTWIVYLLMITLLGLVMCSRGLCCQPQSLGPEHYLTRERQEDDEEEDEEFFSDNGLDSSSSSSSSDDLALAWQKEK